MRRQTPRQNLDLAFHLAEKNFGVTRLLDPEGEKAYSEQCSIIGVVVHDADIDVATPDERSLITYVSALYDVFPETPSPAGGVSPRNVLETALNDNERSLRWEEYRGAATKLLQSLRQAATHLSERNFPNSLTEMRTLNGAFQKRKREELLMLQRLREHCSNLWNQLTLTSSATVVRLPLLDAELRPDQLQRLWEKHSVALQETELAMQTELQRLERLNVAGEKLHREYKACGNRLANAELLLRDCQSHPLDVQNAAEALRTALSREEATVNELFAQVQSLRNNRYNHSEQLYRRVCHLQQRCQEIQRRAKEQVSEV